MPRPPVLAVLDLLVHVQDGDVDELFHARQAATRAARANAGADLVVAALCHDIGKVIADANHGRAAAELLRPFVDPDVCAVVAVHEDFVAAHRSNGHSPDARARHAGRRWYDSAARFADEWDAPSRDLDYDTWPVEAFVPALDEVFGRRPRHGRPGLARLVADEAANRLRSGVGPRKRRHVDRLLGAAEAAARLARRRRVDRG